MVYAVVNISKKANRILNVVKAKYGLRRKSDAITQVVEEYGENLLEREFRPEFIETVLRAKKEPSIRVKNIRDLFG